VFSLHQKVRVTFPLSSQKGRVGEIVELRPNSAMIQFSDPDEFEKERIARGSKDDVLQWHFRFDELEPA
jgi:hypothetical protein